MLLLAIGSLFILIVVFKAISGGDKPYVSSAKNYLEAITDARYSDLYPSSCNSIRQSTNRESLATLQEANWNSRIAKSGEYQSSKVVATSNRGDNAVVEFEVTFSNASEPLQMTMVKESGEWVYCGGGFTTHSGVEGSTETTATTSSNGSSDSQTY